MSPTKHTTNNQSRDFKHHVLTCLHKLSDRDTHSSAATELETIAKTLNHHSLPTFISSILTADSSDKSPVRKQSVRLISILSEAHGNLLSPHVSKLESFIVRRLRDPDTAVRDACVAAAGSVAAHVTKPTFATVVKPFFDALVTEQDSHSQTGSALCMDAVVKYSRDPDVGYLRRVLPKIEKLLKSDGFRGKPALLTVVASVVSIGVASSSVIVRNLVNIMTGFVAGSEDWSVRKAAAEVLERLAVVEAGLLTGFKASCLKTFEAKRIDKVKSVRETMGRMIEAWNAIPDLAQEVSPPPESHSSKEESDIQNPPITPPIINKRTVPYRSKKTGPAMFCKLDRKKPNDQKLNTAEVDLKPMKHETRRALFSEISDEMMHDRSTPRVEGNNGGLNINSVQQDPEDLSLIRNQLAQIEIQQSNLFDLLQKFIGNSMSGMQSLESRVRSVESTLDEISFDLAKSTLNPEPTLCCRLPGADLLSSKLWKKSETQHYPSVNNKDLESFNFQTTGFHLRSGLIKNPLADSANQT